MPLNLADPGVESVIKKVGGSSEVKQHLENLGFVVGGIATVVSSIMRIHGTYRIRTRQGIQKIRPFGKILYPDPYRNRLRYPLRR